MIGHVSLGEILLPVTFQLPDQTELTFQFVVDTGFTGFVALPQSAIDVLRLGFLFPWNIDLADGNRLRVMAYEATLLWEGEKRVVRALAVGKRFLLGTKLLDGHDLQIRFIEGGRVSIVPIPDDPQPEV
jgi:clan AA aspartic protease